MLIYCFKFLKNFKLLKKFQNFETTIFLDNKKFNNEYKFHLKNLFGAENL